MFKRLNFACSIILACTISPNIALGQTINTATNNAISGDSLPNNPTPSDLSATDYQIAQQSPPPPVNPVPSPQRDNRRPTTSAGDEPDVLLDVPNLSVEEINLKVKNLRAHISLDARLANLLQLTAGADVSIDEVDLTIKGVQA